MRILWSVNVVLPEIAKEEGLSIQPYGGWLVGLSSELVKNDEIELAIVAVYPGNQIKKRKLGKILYFLVPNNSKQFETNWKSIIKDFAPDVVHIHGTEYSHNLHLVKVGINIPIVVSIQGLLSSYERSYYAGMEFRDLFFRPTLRDIIRIKTIPMDRKIFQKGAKTEIKILKLTKNVVGRTPWDYANVMAINHQIHYFYCEESLRESFYLRKYDINKIERHTIFVSQASYPIKGFHILLKAAAILTADFPDLQIIVAGYNIIGDSFKQKMKISGYGMYIKKLMKKLNLTDKVKFTGPLNEHEMSDLIVKSNVFVLPSSVENSSNSLAEAMLMGVPCVAAYTGGTPYVLDEGRCGLLYPFMEYPMLAENIRKIFNDDDLAMHYSVQAQKTAAERHDRVKIANSMFEIYKQVISGEKK